MERHSHVRTRRMFLALVAILAGVAATAVASTPAFAGHAYRYLQWSNALAGKCLDVAGQDNGAMVQQYQCNSTVNQQWLQEPTDSGYFTLVVASSGRCLEVPGSSQGNDVVLDITDCNGAFNQQWKLVQIPFFGSWFVARHSGKCLGIRFDDHADRTPAVQYDCDGGPSELWNSRQVTEDFVVFSRFADGHCLDVAGRLPGSRVQQYHCNLTVNQQWQQKFTDSGYFKLAVASSGRCLEVPDSSQAENAAVVIADCTNTFNQQWKQVNVSGRNAATLVARHSGKCLAVLSESTVDRAAVVQRACNPLGVLSENWFW